MQMGGGFGPEGSNHWQDLGVDGTMKADLKYVNVRVLKRIMKRSTFITFRTTV